jgi:septal ring factor EnvC (AmiA/AmiB activator)
MLAACAAPALAAAPGVSPNASGELDFLRRQCVAAAQGVQQREQAALALEHDIDLLGRDADGRQRGLDESRAEQAHLLGTLIYLARHPPERPAIGPGGAVERIRGELLLQGTLPALREEARALVGEIARIGTLRRTIAARQGELGVAGEALGKDRERLAELTAHRLELTDRILPEESGGDARIAKLGREASDVGDLIKRADAATERRDKDILARARADPTRPAGLRAFDPPHSALRMPVSGTITRRFGASDASDAAGAAGAAGGTASQGLTLAALPGAEAVAPFDGRVVYAGPFRNLGLVLIIRHDGMYHSLLAGLGRVDIKADQWVLAGEPVGAMPDAVDKTAGSTLYVELRRDGRPIDPQPWLAPRDPAGDPAGGERRNEPDVDQPGGDKKVRE